MKAILNQALFTKTTADSGAFGLLESVMHRFSEPGEHRVAVYDRDQLVAAADLQVSQESAAASVSRSVSPHVSIDVGALAATAHGHLALAANGYALFHSAAATRAWAVVVERRQPGGLLMPVFDSRRLDQGDVYALTLVRPGTYAVRNTLGHATGAIRVAAPDKPGALRGLPAVHVDGIPATPIEVQATQGLVFRIDRPSRLVIERVEDTAIAMARPTPAGPRKSWRKRG